MSPATFSRNAREGLPERVLLVGTGALASLFAAALSRTGIRVTMLGTWPAAIDALEKRGVRLANGDYEESFPVEVARESAFCGPVDHAIVLVKAWQTARAADQLRKCLSPNGIALTLQNGLGNREILVDALGPERVALGVTTTGATLVAPGVVRPGGSGVISIEEHPRIAPLAALFEAAGFDVVTTPDADSLVWSKLVINAAINPLTALLDIPNGALLEDPELRSLMAELAIETAETADAQGISLNFTDPVAAAEGVARRTAVNFSSMVQDLHRGAPTEIDAICGAITRFGERNGVDTPVNRTMWRLVRSRAALASPKKLERQPA